MKEDVRFISFQI